MLSFEKHIKSAKELADYFARDDYYLSQGGAWWGEGAARLGLTGKVSFKDAGSHTIFQNILEGKSPSGEQLIKVGKNGKRRCGIDMVFSAPKSVSLMARKDERILAAHERAVTAALKYIEERYAKARNQKDPRRVTVENTGNLAVYRTNHIINRDALPQLHSHCVVVNMTQRRDGKWTGLFMDEEDSFFEKRWTNALGTFYRQVLAQELRELDYGIRVTSRRKGFWEVDGVSEEWIDEYSTRAKEVREKVKELRKDSRYAGLADGKISSMAAMMTRMFKPEGKQDKSLYEADWAKVDQKRGVSLEAEFGKAIAAGKAERERQEQLAVQMKSAPTPDEYVKTAAQLITDTESVFSEVRLMEGALNQATGARFNGEEIRQAFYRLLKEQKHVIRLDQNAFTTAEMLRVERMIIYYAKMGKGKSAPLDAAKVDVFLKANAENANPENGTFAYTKGQREAFRMICTSTDTVSLVQGDAGTGKTTMLRGVREIYEGEGWKVRGMSFTGKAASGLEAESDIKSSTVASFLAQHKKDFTDKELWIVDETSMMGAKDWLDVLKLAKKYNAKVVTVGDIKQYPAISSGRTFGILQKKAEIAVSYMTEVTRQETAYMQEAVSLVSNAGRIKNIIAKGEKELLKNLEGGRYDDILESPLQWAVAGALVNQKFGKSPKVLNGAKGTDYLKTVHLHNLRHGGISVDVDQLENLLLKKLFGKFALDDVLGGLTGREIEAVAAIAGKAPDKIQAKDIWRTHKTLQKAKPQPGTAEYDLLLKLGKEDKVANRMSIFDDVEKGILAHMADKKIGVALTERDLRGIRDMLTEDMLKSADIGEAINILTKAVTFEQRGLIGEHIAREYGSLEQFCAKEQFVEGEMREWLKGKKEFDDQRTGLLLNLMKMERDCPIKVYGRIGDDQRAEVLEQITKRYGNMDEFCQKTGLKADDVRKWLAGGEIGQQVVSALYQELKMTPNPPDVEEERLRRMNDVASKVIGFHQKGQKALAITNTNANAEYMNGVIAETMHQDKETFTFTTRNTVGIDSEASSYEEAYVARGDKTPDGRESKGHIVVVMDHIKDSEGNVVLFRGGEGRIVGRDRVKNTITMEYAGKNENGGKVSRTVEINPNALVGKSKIFEEVERTFAVGDRIMVIQNGTVGGKEVTNGMMGEVTGLDKHGNLKMKTDDNKTIKMNLTGKGDTQFNYVRSAWVVTSHKSQGMTTPVILWDVDGSKRYSDMNTTQAFYVALTRARKDAFFFVSNMPSLLEQIVKSQEKTSVLDYRTDMPNAKGNAQKGATSVLKGQETAMAAGSPDSTGHQSR